MLHSSLAAATVRIYYCIRLIQSSDTSYYTALFSLTTFPEIGFGIIACCLPTMPRFVRALKKPQLSPKLASYITTGFYIIRPTKYRRSSRCSLKYNGNNVCKSDEVDARPKQSRRPSESLEMLTVPKRETHCEHTDDHCIHGPPADAHIMRTICIDTVEEPASSLAPYLHRHTGQPWDGQLQDYVQRTQSHK